MFHSWHILPINPHKSSEVLSRTFKFCKVTWIGYLTSFLQRSLSVTFVLMLLQIAVCSCCTRTCVNDPGSHSSGYVWRHEHGGQCNPLADPCVPLHLEGLKWHVMNDFAEPEIFMHELQLYVSLSLLKDTSPFAWKKSFQRGHHILSLTSYWWSRWWHVCFICMTRYLLVY